MHIKDFGLDFPLEGLESHNRVDLETRCIMALYARCFPGLKVDRAWKVQIQCVPEVKRFDLMNFGGCFEIQQAFDLERYRAASLSERKHIALETLHSGALAMAKLCGWPTDPFETAYKCVIERNYVNEWTWPKSPKSSPDRKHKAYLQCLHEHDGFYAWLVIADKKGNILAKEFAFKELPSEFCFMPMLEKLEWASNERVVLFDFQGKEVKALTIPS